MELTQFKTVEQLAAAINSLTMKTEGARVYNDSNISINDDTKTVLTFNSESYDTNSIHDTVSNTQRLTCQTAGYYLAVANVAFDSDADGYRAVYIEHDTAGTIGLTRVNAASTGFVILQAVAFGKLDVDDYLSVWVRHTAGAALNVLYASDYSPVFAMHRII